MKGGLHGCSFGLHIPCLRLLYGRFRVVELKMFELVDTLEAGGSAQALLLKWNGKTYVPFGAMVTLHEYVG